MSPQERNDFRFKMKWLKVRLQGELAMKTLVSNQPLFWAAAIKRILVSNSKRDERPYKTLVALASASNDIKKSLNLEELR